MFETQCQVDKIEDTAKANTKMQKFIATAGSEALRKIIGLMSPKQLQKEMYKDAKEVIYRFIKPIKRLVIADCMKFFSLNQENDEKPLDFLIRLRKASDSCNFDEWKTKESISEEMIRIKFITGLQSKNKQRIILWQNQVNEVSLNQMMEGLQETDEIE